MLLYHFLLYGVVCSIGAQAIITSVIHGPGAHVESYLNQCQSLGSGTDRQLMLHSLSASQSRLCLV